MMNRHFRILADGKSAACFLGYKKILTMKYILCIVGIYLGINLSAFAQCNRQLVEFAARKAGPEAIYIRDFKVKLSAGSMNKPSPTGKFQVYLNEGAKYRFSLSDDAEAEGFAILQLVRKDKLLGSTYSFDEKVNLGVFDYQCNESATYEVIISFYKGLPGCAAGVLSLVLQDSISYIEPGVPTASDSAGTLYLFIENEMQIAASGIPKGYLEVNVSNGTIELRGKSYYLVPEEIGELVVYVAAYKSKGILSEKDSLKYYVEYPPLPNLLLPGMRGNVLYRRTSQRTNKVELTSPVKESKDLYKLEGFSLSSKKDFSLGLISTGSLLSLQQINYLNSLAAGEKFYITEIRFRDPNGKTHYAPVREVWVED